MGNKTFHINSEGNVGKCAALNGNCPFGSSENHYATAEKARVAFENMQANELDKTPLQSKSALKRRVPEAYKELTADKEVTVVSLDSNILKGDTFLTEQGRLYRVALDHDSFDPITSQIKLIELNPKNGVPIEDIERASEYFKDNFSEIVIVANFNNDRNKLQDVENKRRLIETTRGQIAKEVDEAKYIQSRLLKRNPRAFDKMTLLQRMNPSNRSELSDRSAVRALFALRDKKLQQVREEELAIAKAETLNEMQRNLLEKLKLRKLPSIPKIQG